MNMNNAGTLRSIDDSEIGIMRDWRNAPGVRAKMYTRHEITVEEHNAWWERVKNNNTQIYLMYESAGDPLGIVSFTNIDRINRQAFWAFYASPDAPGGTGTRMEILALDYVFQVLKLHKLSCEVLAFNTPVIKLHKKFGFQQEGIFRQHHLVDNNFVDIFRLGILSEEWKQNRAAMKARIEKFDRK